MTDIVEFGCLPSMNPGQPTSSSFIVLSRVLGKAVLLILKEPFPLKTVIFFMCFYFNGP